MDKISGSARAAGHFHAPAACVSRREQRMHSIRSLLQQAADNV